MPRPILATISTQAMAHNLAQVTSRINAVRQTKPQYASHRVNSIAVIKANAYGHGTVNAIKGFQAADALGVIDVQEAVLCREHGWEKEIVLLEGFFYQGDIEVLQEHRITTAIHNDFQWQALKQAKVVKPPLNVLLKFNTGMNRLGFRPEQAKEKYCALMALQAKGIVGNIACMTHFANADSDRGWVQQPYHLIQTIHRTIGGALSICNSAASIRYPEFALHAQENWIRPGICLYGSLPFETDLPELPSLQFKPAMTLTAKVLALQELKKGESVGYGSLFTADKAMKIAVVSCGYADGYPRIAPINMPVTVEGVECRLIGRVSMDMLTVDVSHVPNVHLDSHVVLWGEGGPSIDTVAHLSNRIGYELMCGLAKRVPIHVI